MHKKMPKVCIVHDWLYVLGGAERVLEQLLLLFPQADVVTLIDRLPSRDRGILTGHRVRTSFIQKLPWALKNHRIYLPLMPMAIEDFDLSEYDLVISSSSAVAKGVITGPNQPHISYVHSPMRYAWDLQHEYLNATGISRSANAWLAKLILHRIRIWDGRTANGVDTFVANSEFIAQRIWKIYRRKATVIHPPIDISSYFPGGSKSDFYVTASRLVPYKRIDAIVQAFARLPDRKLVVIGDGPDFEKIKAIAPANVHMMGYQSQDVLRRHLQEARAFIFAAREDFGIAPLEAQACGTPVIAYGCGGATETIRAQDAPSPTGHFFAEQTPDCIAEAVRAFELREHDYSPRECRLNAQRFSPEHFRSAFASLVAQQTNLSISAEEMESRIVPDLPRRIRAVAGT
jgi:Glycosyltransferase